MRRLSHNEPTQSITRTERARAVCFVPGYEPRARVAMIRARRAAFAPVILLARSPSPGNHDHATERSARERSRRRGVTSPSCVKPFPVNASVNYFPEKSRYARDARARYESRESRESPRIGYPSPPPRISSWLDLKSRSLLKIVRAWRD